MVRLSQVARAEGHRLHVHETLGSTNAEALAQARSGERGPLWVVANRQSEGRGRRGSRWISPEGNLAASLLMPVADVPPEQVATLGFVAGLALVRALDTVDAGLEAAGQTQVPSPVRERDRVRGQDFPERSHPSPQPSPAREMGHVADAIDGGLNREAHLFALKWPNDVLAEGRKLAGILLEAEGRRAVVIGFGVNVAAAPDGLPYPATALASLGCGAGASDLFEALTAGFVEAAAIWDRGRGFSALRRLWLARAAGIGKPVSVTTQGGRLSGLHHGIDEGGRLVILAPDGATHTVTAGEVHFGEAATAA